MNNDLQYFGHNAIIIKEQKLERLIENAVWKNMQKLENKFQELLSDQNKFLTRQQAIDLLQISPSTYDNWVRSKRLLVHKIGDKPYVYMSDIRKAMLPIN